MNELRICPSCQRVLTRIDHYGIEHLILDNNVFRPLNAAEGLASEVDLRCGFCHTPVPHEVREFFYRRWCAMLDATRCVEGDGPPPLPWVPVGECTCIDPFANCPVHG